MMPIQSPSSCEGRLRLLHRSLTPTLEIMEQQRVASAMTTTLQEEDMMELLSSQESLETIMSDDPSCTDAVLPLSITTQRHSEDELTTSSSSRSTKRRKQNGAIQDKRFKELDVNKYMASREMTPFQERMNAVTVMPGAFYCIMYTLSGSWLSPSFVEEHNNAVAFFDDARCLSWSWMPHLHAAPPLPLVAAALGIVAHAPFSFIYHWKYAHRLPAGLPRTNHWSRRMDQAMIHFCSLCMAYATSGRMDFFLANALFNVDCIYRQFIPKVRPRRNQMRIFISLVAYTIPLLRRGDLTLFAKLWTLLSISGWLFSQYPVGGWSHSIFHIVMAFVPPLLMTAAVELPASHSQLEVAAQCAMVAKHSFVS